ncbi:MAG: aminotransferase class V-fold PLP-dependent enzyme [Chitinophagaceae bacterium]|nr:aminotransferase class V-fold PLP-dependent enzyme [Chitinophagaceae bacterium]
MIDTIPAPLQSEFSLEEITQFRKETTGTSQVIHFNNAGAGLMPDIVTKAQLDHIILESQIGGYEAAALQQSTIRSFYHQCALLLNCKPSNIAFTASATDSYTRALSSIPFTKGDIILTDCDDFVSNQIQFLSLQKRFGIEIMHIQNAAIGGVDLNDLKHKLYKHKPKLLAITHIPTNSGLIQPVEEIAIIYAEYKNAYPDITWYILDACQSAGQTKLDTQQLQCDFLSITCRKFLRGPRGTGALYISDRTLLAGLEPLFIDMRGAEWIEKDLYRQQPDGRRFEDWEFAYSTVTGTSAAIQYCLNIGVERIEKQVRLLSDWMRKKLSEIDAIRILDRGPEQGGLVTFHIHHGDPVQMVEGLHKRKINVVPSYRAFGVLDFDEKSVKWAIRASPHYYNTVEEIELFADAVRDMTKR